MAEIRVQNLHKAFADFVAVRDSSFAVKDGEFFCLLGPSGCGKTTTLRMIAGLELPTAGQIFLGNEDVTLKRASHRDIAFVFQLFALYPHLNVRRNIGFPLVSQGVPRQQIAAKVAEAQAAGRIAPEIHPYTAAAALASMLERLAAFQREVQAFGVTRAHTVETCARILVQATTGRSAS